MKTVYIADDGMPFKTAEECMAHEEEVKKVKPYRVVLNFIGSYEELVYASSEEEAIASAKESFSSEDIDWDDDPDYPPIVEECKVELANPV